METLLRKVGQHPKSVFGHVEMGLKKSALEMTLGYDSLFLKTEESEPIGHEFSCLVIDLETKLFKTMSFEEIVGLPNGYKSNKAFLINNISYFQTKCLLYYMSEQKDDKFDGILLWEIQLLQHYDKFKRFS